jgi:hypothetical protein
MRMNPKTSTTGGMTNGRSVMNSITGRSWGTLSLTQYAVGTMISRLTRIVTIPTANEKPSRV